MTDRSTRLSRPLDGRSLAGGSAALQLAWRRWDDLRGADAVPSRAALDEASMAPILAGSIILDRVRPGTARIRIAGATMGRMMGMEARGLPVRALFSLDDRPRIGALMDETFSAPVALRLDLETDDDRRTRAAMIVLPLRDGAGETTKALATLDAGDVAPRAPQRFRIVEVRRARITTAPLPSPYPTAQPATLPLEAAEDAAHFAGATRVPWLRVVK